MLWSFYFGKEKATAQTFRALLWWDRRQPGGIECIYARRPELRWRIEIKGKQILTGFFFYFSFLETQKFFLEAVGNNTKMLDLMCSVRYFYLFYLKKHRKTVFPLAIILCLYSSGFQITEKINQSTNCPTFDQMRGNCWCSKNESCPNHIVLSFAKK